MLTVKYTKSFSKKFKKRIPQGSALASKYAERFDLFITDRKDPILRDHALSGKGNLRAFWITGDVRVIYYLDIDETAVFVDIGSHSQVYGK